MSFSQLNFGKTSSIPPPSDPSDGLAISHRFHEVMLRLVAGRFGSVKSMDKNKFFQEPRLLEKNGFVTHLRHGQSSHVKLIPLDIRSQCLRTTPEPVEKKAGRMFGK